MADKTKLEHTKSEHIKPQEKREERLVRILSKDIEGKMKIYVGLTKIKGISWTFSNAVCKTLNFNKNKTIGTLTDEEIQKITDFIKDPKLPNHLLNRRKDLETGKEKHLTGTDLDLRKDFDIKKLKKIKSYRGLRHTSGLPLRGQRTKANFRKNRKKSSGIKKKAKEGTQVKVYSGKKK